VVCPLLHGWAGAAGRRSAPASLLAVVTAAALALRDLASRALPARITGTQILVWAFASLVPAGLLMMLALGSVPVLPAAPDLLRLGGAFVVGGAAYLAIVDATFVAKYQRMFIHHVA